MATTQLGTIGVVAGDMDPNKGLPVCNYKDVFDCNGDWVTRIYFDPPSEMGIHGDLVGIDTGTFVAEDAPIQDTDDPQWSERHKRLVDRLRQCRKESQ